MSAVLEDTPIASPQILDPLGFMEFPKEKISLREALFDPHNPRLDCYLLEVMGTREGYRKALGKLHPTDSGIKFELFCQLQLLKALLPLEIKTSEMKETLKLEDKSLMDLLEGRRAGLSALTFVAVAGLV